MARRGRFGNDPESYDLEVDGNVQGRAACVTCGKPLVTGPLFDPLVHQPRCAECHRQQTWGGRYSTGTAVELEALLEEHAPEGTCEECSALLRLHDDGECPPTEVEAIRMSESWRAGQGLY